MSKIYKLIRPQSLTDSVYEDFEYLIRWIGRDGAEYLYMFYDARIRTRIKADVINELDGDRIESLIDSEENEITLSAVDLSKNDMLVIGEMFANKYVTRLKKDGSIERFATESNNYRYTLRNYRYEVEFSLRKVNNPVWK